VTYTRILTTGALMVFLAGLVALVLRGQATVSLVSPVTSYYTTQPVSPTYILIGAPPTSATQSSPTVWPCLGMPDPSHATANQGDEFLLPGNYALAPVAGVAPTGDRLMVCLIGSTGVPAWTQIGFAP
jgi:hypothetical protein